MNTTQAVGVPEHKLVTWTRDVAKHEVQDGALLNGALAMAEGARGIVITNDGEAQRALDADDQVVAGLKLIAAAKKRACKVPKEMIAVVTEFFEEWEVKLKSAHESYNGANLRWLREQRLRIEREAAEAKLAAQRAAAEEQKRIDEARAQAEQVAAASNMEPEVAAAFVAASVLDVDPVVPMEEMPLPERAGKQVRGSGGSMRSLTKNLTAKIVALADVDPVLVELRMKDACDIARREIGYGNLATPGIGEEKGVVLGGIRYWYDDGIASRSAR